MESRRDLYVFESPTHFPPTNYTFRNNEVTEKGFKLGKMLFFDPSLSRDGSVACASCHVQSHAFADIPLHPFSFGVDDSEGRRNTPPLFNLAWHKEFFWDGGVTHLDFAPILAIESEIEMDESFENVVEKLRNHVLYPQLFKEAFGIEEITGPFVLHSLSQFMLLMVSSGSRYDQYVNGDHTALSKIEVEGLKIFRNKCGSCHQEPLFTDLSYKNNGIQKVVKDIGRAEITEVDFDIAKFKVPSLRNIEVTAPYMHNAAFDNLDAVLEHYRSGVAPSPTLANELITNGELGIPMSDEEMEAIKSFLRALTDTEFLNNPIFFRNHE